MFDARLAYQAGLAGEDVVPKMTQALWSGGIEASSAFTEYVHLRPSDPSGQFGLGRTFMQSGTASDAAASFRKTLQFNPGQRAAADSLVGLLQ